MRVPFRPSVFGVFAIAALACGGNAPLTSKVVDQPGGAGATGGSPAGSSGVGTAGAPGGAAGAPSTGAAGAPSTGTAGATATGTAGATATGTAGATATGQAGAGGQSSPGITMCGSPTLPNGLCAMGAYKHTGVTSACVCQDVTPCVCGGTCTDPLVDDDNCGVCGLRCGPTSTCNGGICGPASTIVVPAQSGCTSIDLAVSGTTLYWTDSGHGVVQSMPIGGGVTTTYASGEVGPTRITVAGTSLFWLDKGTALRKLAANLTLTTVFEAAAPIGGLVSPDGGIVYFSSDTTIYSLSAAGRVPVVVARETQGGLPGGLALEGNTLAYPTGLNGDVDVVTLVPGQVASCGPVSSDGSFTGVNCARFARSQGELFLDTILMHEGQVIWLDGSNVKIESATSGGTSDTVSWTEDDVGTGLAMRGTNVYFSEGAPGTSGKGVIYRAPVTASQTTAVRLARGQNGPRSLAVGATKVFWSTSDCSIESTGL
jgi:hypothetical protein